MSTVSRKHYFWIWGGLVFIFTTLQYFAAQILVSAAWKDPSYSWNRNYISDLGNTACGDFSLAGHVSRVCSPKHGMMNASFMVSGVLLIIGALLLWRLWPHTKPARVGEFLLLLAGLLKIVVGLAPENKNLSLHTLGATNLVIGSVAVLLLSLSVRRSHPVVHWLGILTSVVGLVGGTLFTMSQRAGHSPIPGLGVGGLERLAGYPFNLWMVGIGLLAIVRASGEPLRSRSQADGASGVPVGPESRHAHRAAK
ncbi:DUF998 domain-containing protein [Streptomyces sp. NPDC088794]|uniref:DUF998 domain-containing protein n=1 Tax=Streptomyces sp. NPDC088794 TaxID=3365902 RepID=UPI0037F9DFD4